MDKKKSELSLKLKEREMKQQQQQQQQQPPPNAITVNNKLATPAGKKGALKRQQDSAGKPIPESEKVQEEVSLLCRGRFLYPLPFFSRNLKSVPVSSVISPRKPIRSSARMTAF